MGRIPARVAAHPQRHRGDHPLNSFSALGPLAQAITAGQTPSEVYAPLEVVADLGGAVALLGVDLTSMTLLHLAGIGVSGARLRVGKVQVSGWARGTAIGFQRGVETGYGGPPADTGRVRR